MQVDTIKNGIVIDHITAGKGMEIYKLLGLDSLECSIAFIKNAPSRKMGKKDIIKIDADLVVDTAILGFVDPDVTVNSSSLTSKMISFVCFFPNPDHININKLPLYLPPFFALFFDATNQF